MLQTILNSFFGCAHTRTTFPLTPSRRGAQFTGSASRNNGAYVVCLDCGKEFAYDWQQMRVGRAVEPATLAEPASVRAPARVTATLP